MSEGNHSSNIRHRRIDWIRSYYVGFYSLFGHLLVHGCRQFRGDQTVLYTDIRSLTDSNNNSRKGVSAIYLSICHLFIYLSVYLSIHVFIHLYLFVYSDSTTYLIRDVWQNKFPWVFSGFPQFFPKKSLFPGFP